LTTPLTQQAGDQSNRRTGAAQVIGTGQWQITGVRTRSDLQELVDKIPETEIDHIAMLVRAVRENNRPLIAALTAAPVDDESTRRWLG
jgi:hypothetical protein